MVTFVVEYWLEVLFTAFGAVMIAWIKRVNGKLKHKQLEQDALRNGMIALLHSKLTEICGNYLKLGYIPVEESEDVLNEVKLLYEAYHGIGGNGTGTMIYEKFTALPIKNSV